MKKYIFFIIIVLLSVSAFGQEKFKHGYIVTISNDTIFGKICQQKPKENKIICKFQTPNGEIVNYNPNKISAFGYKKGSVYASKKMNEKDFFVEYLVKGNLNLYHLKDGKNNRYFIDNETDSLVEILLTYETFIGETGMKLRRLSKQHIEILTKYTAKVPDLKKKINKIDYIDNDILIEIVEKYNKTLCGQKKCQNECCKVLQTDIYKFGVELNPVLGFTRFAKKDLAFTGGIIGYYKLPKCGNKLFVKAGFLFLQITQPQEITKQKSFVQFPVQIEARYQTKYFCPKIALGLNLTSLKHFSQFYHSMFSFGVDVRLVKKIYFSLNYDLNFEPLFLIIPLRVSSHSLLFGANFVF